MKIERFAVSYNDGKKMHVYFFPGRDEKGHFTSRFTFMTSGIEYQYTKQEDGGIDYIILNDVPVIECLIQNMSDGKTEKIEFRR